MNEVYSYLCFDVCGFAAIIHWIPLFIPWRGDDDREEKPSVSSAVSVVKKNASRRGRKESAESAKSFYPLHPVIPRFIRGIQKRKFFTTKRTKVSKFTKFFVLEKFFREFRGSILLFSGSLCLSLGVRCVSKIFTRRNGAAEFLFPPSPRGGEGNAGLRL